LATLASAIPEILKGVSWSHDQCGHMTLTTPLSGTLCYRLLGHAMINLPTKFEVPNFTRYGNIKGVAKYR